MNKWIRGTNAFVLSIAVIGIFIVLTIFLNSAKSLQIDMTVTKKFTLSEQTTEVLDKLEQDIRVVSFVSDKTDPFIQRQVVELVEEYKRRTKHITFEEYDINSQPAMARQYDVNATGTLIVESGSQKNTLYFFDMFYAGQQSGEYLFSGEEKLTQSITNLISTEKRTAYFLSGHGEFPLSQMSVWTSGLQAANYEVKELNLLRDGEIPADAELLFIIGAQNDINDLETQMIKSFLEDKGKLFIALGFSTEMEKWANIDSLMAMYGIQSHHAVAIEAKETLGADPLTIVPQYTQHDITSKLQEYNLLSVMTLSVPLTTVPDHIDHNFTALLTTSPNAYGETDLDTLARMGQSGRDDSDVDGPLNLAYAVTDIGGIPQAVVLGSSAFLLDQYIMQQGNRDFALNSVGWLQRVSGQVTIRPRAGDPFQMAEISNTAMNWIFYGTVILFPLMFLIIGGTIWWRRRKA